MSFFDIFRINEYKQRIAQLESDYNELSTRYSAVGMPDYNAVQEMIANAKKEYEQTTALISTTKSDLTYQNGELEKTTKSLRTQKNKLAKTKELVRAIQYAIDNSTKLSEALQSDLDEYAPTVTLKLHCMDVKDLRKAYRENDKQITKLMDSYSSRYTTKANQAIYQLMVIALRAELQNILYSLKYQKLDDSIDKLKEVTQKYLQIAGSGNQSIAGTLTKFIGELEYLFINAIKIEYNYYVKKEQAKQEQLAIKEQMRQEADERKAL